MERFAFTFAAFMLFAGSTQASSLIALDAMEKPHGPSMVVVGVSSDSPSVVSITSEDRTVSDEKVAAIGEDANARSPDHFEPMVIRGGIVGDAFTRTIALAPASALTPRPASKTASAEAPPAQEPTPPSNMPELAAPR